MHAAGALQQRNMCSMVTRHAAVRFPRWSASAGAHSSATGESVTTCPARSQLHASHHFLRYTLPRSLHSSSSLNFSTRSFEPSTLTSAATGMLQQPQSPPAMGGRFSPSQRASSIVSQLLSPSRAARTLAPASPASPSPPSPSPQPPLRLLHAHTVAAASSAAAPSSPSSHRSLSSASPLPYTTPTPVSSSDPHLMIRRACAGDFAKGHVNLLSQLSSTGDVSEAAYAARLDAMARCGSVYHLLVIEDTSLPSPSGNGRGLIIASATLVVEMKLLHSCGSAGHVEDVVVREGYRGKQLGVRIVSALGEVAKAVGCYKIMLDCKESNIPFYEKMGYQQSQRHMRLDLQ